MANPNIFKKSPMVMEIKAGKYYWCSCGKSENQPYCNGSHKGSEFSPMEIEFAEDTKVAWCLCKQSGKKPLCDGTHKKL